MTMRALVKVAPEPGLELVEIDVPRPGPREVLVKVAAAAVCGSDVARYRWDENYWAGGAKDMTRDLPRVLGHEFAGTVADTYDDGTSRLSAGQPVAIRNVLGCGRCDACAEGFTSTCAFRRTIGVHVDGGYAEYAAVPADNCTVLDESTDLHLAAALQPFAVATNGFRRAELAAGARIAVWGLGQIGWGVVCAAQLAGVRTVACFDMNPVRLDDARAAGLRAYDPREVDVADLLPPSSVDAVFDCAGAAGEILGHVRAVRPRGAVVLIGNLRSTVEVDFMPVVMAERRVVGCRSYSAAAWAQAVRTIEGSGFERSLGDLVPISEALARFELAAQGQGRPFAVVP